VIAASEPDAIKLSPAQSEKISRRDEIIEPVVGAEPTTGKVTMHFTTLKGLDHVLVVSQFVVMWDGG
jgi:hypothetical protein